MQPRLHSAYLKQAWLCSRWHEISRPSLASTHKSESFQENKQICIVIFYTKNYLVLVISEIIYNFITVVIITAVIKYEVL